MRRFVLLIWFGMSLAWLAPTRASNQNLRCENLPAGPRIVAIGDVHGELGGLKTILQEAGLLDAAGEWVGEDSILVQTGDLLDRGPDERGVLDLAMGLDARASRSGGQARFLLGNHEVMNLYGDMRYVPEAGYSQFADDNSEKKREKGFRQYQRFLKAQARFLGVPPPEITESLRQNWYTKHPPGYLERREAFSAGGRYGKWLREQDAIFQTGGFIFLHGGLDPVLPADLPRLNSVIRQEIRNYDKIRRYLAQEDLILEFHEYSEALRLAESYAGSLRSRNHTLTDPEQDLLHLLDALISSTNWLSVHSGGPLWFRGYANWSDPEGAPLAEDLVSRFDTCGLVVGHSPQLPDGITARFGGRIFLIDTGMLSSHYDGGTPAALQIDQTGVSALYPAGRRVRLSGLDQNHP